MARLPPCPGAFLASVLLVLLSEARGDCGPPKSLPNARIREAEQQSYPVGTRLTYVCIPGFELISRTPQRTECLATSQWSEVPAKICQGRRCPYPPIDNGRVAGDSELRLGDQITFFCDEGYRAIGHNGARCTLQGNKVDWDRAPPHCERIPCFPPPQIANGFHDGQDGQDYLYGSAVTYRCDRDFSLIGSKTIVCIFGPDMNGKWSGPAPECKDGTLLPSSGPSALPTLQTELGLEKLFIILQEIKDIVNIKTKSLEERLDGLEKKVDKVIYELSSCCQQAKERAEDEQ